MAVLLALVLLWLAAGPTRAQASTWAWASGGAASAATALDAAGHATAGRVFASPTLVCGPTTLSTTAPITHDGWVARPDPTGAWRWAASGGGAGDENLGHFALKGAGGVVVPGLFAGAAATFGVTTLASPRTSTGFTARLTAPAPTGVPEAQPGATGLALFPYPAHTEPALALPAAAAKGLVTVRNLLGAVVLTQPLSAGTCTLRLDVADLPAGVYLIPVPAANGPTTRRFVKQ